LEVGLDGGDDLGRLLVDLGLRQISKFGQTLDDLVGTLLWGFYNRITNDIGLEGFLVANDVSDPRLYVSTTNLIINTL